MISGIVIKKNRKTEEKQDEYKNEFGRKGSTCNGTTAESCLEEAYEVIKDRKGKMIDGVFVKEEYYGETQITCWSHPIFTEKLFNRGTS